MSTSTNHSISTRGNFGSRQCLASLPRLAVDFGVLTAAAAADVGGLALTIVVRASADPVTTSRMLDFVQSALRTRDALWLVADDDRQLITRDNVRTLDLRIPRDLRLSSQLIADLLCLPGDASTVEEFDRWKRRAGFVLVDARHGHAADVLDTAREQRVRHRLWLGGPMLIGDNGNTVGVPARLAQELAGIAEILSDQPDKKSLFRPYVSGLFESTDGDNFDTICAFLTSADESRFPRWAAEVLSSWYVVDRRIPAQALVSDYLLREAFGADIVASFCGGAFHLATLNNETHKVLRIVVREVRHALSASPLDWNTERAFAGLCAEGLIRAKRLHEFDLEHKRVLAKVKRRLIAEARRAQAA